MTRQHILEAIKRATQENGGKPLGILAFFRETGISQEDWRGKLWARWGDAVREAGYEPNTLQVPYEIETLLLRVIELTRKLGHIPVRSEVDLEARAHPGFPVFTTLSKHFGPKTGWGAKIAEYCRNHSDFDDVIPLCGDLIEESGVNEAPAIEEEDGWVYLLKSGLFYKIGRTNNLARRRGQLAIQLPESVEIIHQIRTDDPAGIEAYWHRRFEAKRKEGEWFALTTQEVRSFKKRKTFM